MPQYLKTFLANEQESAYYLFTCYGHKSIDYSEVDLFSRHQQRPVKVRARERERERVRVSVRCPGKFYRLHNTTTSQSLALSRSDDKMQLSTTHNSNIEPL